jgi:hypothetical protein
MNSNVKYSLPVLAAVGALALAAAVFIANQQPYGYIAPPALNTQNFLRGSPVAYTPWFENGTFKGDLLALPIGTTGSVAVIAPLWRASLQLDAQNPTTGRRIVTTNGSGTATAFQWSALTASQQTQLGSAAVLNFIRGVRTGEGTTYRLRSSVLGDIIHSNPAYVGKPVAGYTFDSYLAYAAANVSRPPRVAVGANDGMLHVFNAETGDEVFAYVPSMVVPNLSKLAANPYAHTYFVDGPLTAGDARFDSSWHSVLVGGLAAGGRGYFALDLTSAAVASEAATTDKVLWEFHAGSAGATNLGYGYSRPSIVRLNNGQWAALLANGYLSATGRASLYLLDIESGAVIRELVVPDADANGLSSPTAIDTNGDFKVDVAYAGDLNGNVWEFNLSGSTPASWQVANAAEPLFQTELAGTVRQPITTAPEVGRHPQGGFMVFVGTGRLLSVSDGGDKTQQAVYGLWDNGWPAAELPIDPAALVSQQLFSATHTSTGASTRTASANSVDWAVHRGWKMPLEIAGASSLDQGERLLQDLTLRDNRVHLMSINPSIPTGDNWYLQLNAFTGGAPPKTIVDINRDFVLNVADNVDGDGSGEVTDAARDRIVGEFQSFGLASRPIIGVVGTFADAALINHLSAISPGLVSNPTDPGLLGGHFDLDTASEIYGFNSGTTDGHVHEWDDKHDLTTINYFALPDGHGNPLYEITNDSGFGVQSNSLFILTVANTAMSPGGVLEINGASIGVEKYHALVKRFLSGTLLPGETFPVYKMTPPTNAETAAGIQRLTSLKMSFDAFAIISGDLIPTNTSCVRGNTAGALGEYRNGALLVQALDAEDISDGYVLDPVKKEYEADSNSVHATLGYATDGLLWESTVFWHWDGPCYGEASFAAEYKACVVDKTKTCYKTDTALDEDKEKKGKKKKTKKGEEPPPPPPPGPGPVTPPAPIDPLHSVTDTTIAGDNKTGRLFWKEMVPVE